MSTLRLPPRTPSAAEAYDSLADVYDVLTGAYAYGPWLRAIEALAAERGVHGRRLLDIACGTGKSFLPLAEAGYQVSACDVSPGMVAIAQRKAPEATITVADMRYLERLGEFDLITCLDDAVNYLLDVEDLEGFFRGVALNLAPGGLAVFDANSVRAYENEFARDWLAEDASCFIAWSAKPSDGGAPDRHRAVVHIFARQGAGWSRRQSIHEQRHWSREQIEAAATCASLKIMAVYGQHRGAVLEPSFDEMTHNKALYLLAHEERG
jgi:SAM-dependent methyltransferase